MSRRRALWRALQIALLLAIAYGLYRVVAGQLVELTWDDVLRWRPAVVPLLLSFVLLVAVQLANAFLWRRIMHDLAIGRPSARATVSIYFTSALGRFLPGKIWQLPFLAVLAKRAGLPPGSAAAAQVLGQFGFLTTGILFLGITLPTWRHVLQDRRADALLVAMAVLVIGAALLWIVLATPLGHGLRERAVRLLGERGGERLTAAFALADRVRPSLALSWAAGYTLTWVLLGGAFVLFAAAFVPDAVAAQPRFVAGTVALSYLVGYLLPTPAGLGREVPMFVLLERVMPQPGAALVVSVLSRVWFIAAELAPLALVPVLRGDAVVREEQA